MEDYTVCVTDDSYFSYPDEKEIISIKQSLVSKPMKVTLDSLINSLDKSSKVVLLSHNKKEGHRVVFDYQDVVMLEITNTNHNYQKYTLEDAKKNQFLQENAYFIVENKVSKRITNLVIAFKLSRGLTYKKEVESVYSQLFNLNSIFNSQLNLEKIRSNSLFLVNTNNAYVYNEDNLLIPDNINKDFKLLIEKIDKEKAFLSDKKDFSGEKFSYISDKLNIPKKDLDVKTLFTQHKFNELKEVFSDLEYNFGGEKYSNLNELSEFICKNVSLTKVFGLSLNTKFVSLFDSTVTDELDVIVLAKDKTEIYISDSGNRLYRGNLVSVLSKLTQLSKFETLNIIAELVNIEITVDDDTQVIIENTNNFIESLLSGKLENKYPNLFKSIKSNSETIAFLLRSILESPMYDWNTNSWSLTSAKSLNTLSTELSKEKGKTSKSRSSLSRILYLMIIVGLISKLSDDELPSWLKNNLKTYQNNNGYKQRTEVITINPINEDNLIELEKKAENLNDLKFKVSLISYDYILLNLGKDVADKLYIQKTEDERKLSNKLNRIREISAKYFSYQLDSYGYVEESKIINIVKKSIKRNKKTQDLMGVNINTEFKTLSNSFYDLDGVILSKVVLTKQLRIDLNITELTESKRHNIFIR